MKFIWDFVLIRDDGSRVSLHPNWSNTWVECKHPREPQLRDLTIPRNGLGGSNGRFTIRHFTQKHIDEYLRFDVSKCKPQSRDYRAPLAIADGSGV